MEFEKQRDDLPVLNIDEFTTTETAESKRHGPLLPNTVRMLLVGPSNCGKTNALLSLVISPNGLHFENVHLYSKSRHQPKYLFLEKVCQSTECVCYCSYSEKDEVIKPENARPNSLFIFDDVAIESQDIVREYFCMGRHYMVDCCYLCQTYSRIPKQLVRDNANFLVIFKQDETNLRHIYDDHVNTDMSLAKFKDLCTQCWSFGNFSFISIDKDRGLNEGRYRRGFDCFIKGL